MNKAAHIYAILFLLLLFQSNAFSQRYTKKIFSLDQITIVEDIVYAEINPNGFFYNSIENTEIVKRDTTIKRFLNDWMGKKLRADVYTPPKDVPLRPMVLFFHGGGFIIGQKNDDVAKTFCMELAQRGYVVASVNYRQVGVSTASLKSAGYIAAQDARAALRFFRKTASDYSVDSNYIYIGGESTGAVVALHAAFLDQEELQIELGNQIDEHFGCLDCIGTELENSKPRAVINISGGILDLDILSNNQIPVISFHGTSDKVIKINYGLPRANLSTNYNSSKNWFNKQLKNFGGYFNIEETTKSFGLAGIEPLYGSELIHKKLEQLKVKNEYHAIKDYGHHLIISRNGTVRGSAPQLFQDLSKFLLEDMYFTSSIKGKDEVPHGISTEYQSAFDAFDYHWTIDGGKITDYYGKSVKVKWDKHHQIGTIRLVTTSHMGVQSAPSVFQIAIQNPTFDDKVSEFVKEKKSLTLLTIISIFSIVTILLYNLVKKRSKKGINFS